MAEGRAKSPNGHRKPTAESRAKSPDSPESKAKAATGRHTPTSDSERGVKSPEEGLAESFVAGILSDIAERQQDDEQDFETDNVTAANNNVNIKHRDELAYYSTSTDLPAPGSTDLSKRATMQPKSGQGATENANRVQFSNSTVRASSSLPSFNNKRSSLGGKVAPSRTSRRGAAGIGSISVGINVMKSRKSWLRKRTKHSWPLFSKVVHVIEGTYGSSVGSFFHYARWVFALNLFLACLWIVFIIIPQAVFFDYSSVNRSFNYMNVYDFKGPLEQTWLFYGNFQPRVGSYRVWFVHYICICITFYISGFVIIYSIALAIQEDGGNVALSGSFTFTNLTFVAWDYTIRQHEASIARSAGIANAYRDLKSDIDNRARLINARASNLTVVYLRRFLAWAIAVVLLALGVTLVAYIGSMDLVDFMQRHFHQGITETSFVVSFAPSFVFVVMDQFVSNIMYLLPRFEGYIRPQVEFYITISRVFFIKSTVVVAYTLTIRQRILSLHYHGCGGTILGQEMHRMVLAKIGCIFVDTVLYSIKYAWTKFKQKPEFTLAPVIQDYIQVQAYIWVGVHVYPLLLLYALVFVSVSVYTHYWMLRYVCRPLTSRRWMQQNRSIIFLVMTGVMLVLVALLLLGTGLHDHHILFSLIARGSVINRNHSDYHIGVIGNYSNELYCGPLSPHQLIFPLLNLVNEFDGVDNILTGLLRFISADAFYLTVIFILSSFLYVMVVRLQWELQQRHLLSAEQQMARMNERKKKSTRNAALFS